MSQTDQAGPKNLKEKSPASGQKDLLVNNLGKRLEELSRKGLNALKIGANKATHFANETSHLARLKLEIRSLNDQIENLHLHIGKRLWELHSEGGLTKTTSKTFGKELQKLDELLESLKSKNMEVKDIDLIE